MAAYISNLFHLTHSSIQLINRLRYQKRFISQSLACDLDAFQQSGAHPLDPKEMKKITHYYGLAVPAILGEAFGILLAKPMSRNERMALTYLGGATGLFDDFFDKHHLPKDYILDLLRQSRDLIVTNANEQLFLNLYGKALEHAANPDLVRTYSLKIFESEVLSEKQLNPEIDIHEIKRITLEKGGVSLLFYRSGMDAAISDEEKVLFFHLGGLLQLENDIFDIYKDHRDGIKTLATTATKIEPLRVTYTTLTDQVIRYVHETAFSEKNKRQFIDIMLIIIGRGFVCLDMLARNEKSSNNVFSIDSYSRKDLICDMEKPINMLRTIHYFATYNPA
ncbi:MAG: class 1 isoprenoid biosynthesis enzyme [Bacteroidales bacterium]|nr:class 1 isoprenoid biosynthesis enzyme [Bacteroidales bacterium]